MSWGVGIRLAYQLDIFPIEEPVAIKALDGDFWLICSGMTERGRRMEKEGMALRKRNGEGAGREKEARRGIVSEGAR